MQRVKLKDWLRWPALILLALLVGNVRIAEAVIMSAWSATDTANGGYTFNGSAETTSTDFFETNAEGITARGDTGVQGFGGYDSFANTFDAHVLLFGTVPLENSDGSVHGNARAHVSASSMGSFTLGPSGDAELDPYVPLTTFFGWGVGGQIAEGDSVIVHLESRISGPNLQLSYNSADIGDFRLGPGSVSIHVGDWREWNALDHFGLFESVAAFSFSIEHNMGSSGDSRLELLYGGNLSYIPMPEPATLSIFCIGLLGVARMLFRHRFGKIGR